MSADVSAHVNARVSVVVLSHNRRAELLRTLAALCALPERPRVIVADNASADGSADAVALAYPAVELLRLRVNIGAAARNLGVQRVTTPYVAFSDDDTHWQPGALARASRLLDAHGEVAVVCARVLVGDAGREDATCALMARSPLGPLAGGMEILGFMAGASVLRREAFIACGGYDARFFIGGEEELLALDLAAQGWRMVYDAQAVVRHFPSPLRDAAQRRWLLARNALWVAGLRLPLRAALARCACRLAAPALRGQRLHTLRQTLRGLPWVLRERRPLPPAVEARRRRVEADCGVAPKPDRVQPPSATATASPGATATATGADITTSSSASGLSRQA